MGIKPKQGDPVIIPPDNVQTRWGAWEADLADNGEVAGEVLADTWALADSANSRVDLLDPIMDVAQAYMPSGLGFSGTGRLPFRHQRGPARGVRLENDGMRLLGAGAWQISVETRVSWIRLQGNDVTYHVNCYDPQGNLYTYQSFIDRSSSDTHSVSFGADFVVPEPNYFISVSVFDVAAGRKHLGGWAITRMVAKRWSSQFINPPTGGGADTDISPS